MRFSLIAFKPVFVLLILILNAPTSYAALGEVRIDCGGDRSVPCEKQTAGGSLRGMSEDDGEATNDEAPEAAATEATPEVSSDEAAGEPSGEAEATSDEAGDASSDGGSEEEESDAMVDSDEEYEE
jgi:hypothetical protein